MTTQGWKNWAIFLAGCVVGYSGFATLAIGIGAFAMGFIIACSNLSEREERRKG